MRTFDYETELQICDLYETQGLTQVDISKIYHCRKEAIRNVLNKHNITIKAHVSKNRLLRHDFFHTIDTEEKAYILRLLFADGYVIANNTNRQCQVGITLKRSDEAILQKIKDILKVGADLTYDNRVGKECVVLRFRSDEMAKDLSQYGIVPNKTYVTEHLPEISNDLMKHFLRGLLDGDGSIFQITNSERWAIDFCSYHQSICEEFRQQCNKLIDSDNNSVIKNYGTAYHMRYQNKNDVKKLATALYKDNKIALPRKNELANAIMNK